jgi:hypothetical protein
MALAALSAVAVLDVGSRTAEAAPSVSPFAGTYVCAWSAVTISDAGRISGAGVNNTISSISGRVRDDGSFSMTVTESGYSEDETPPYGKPKRWTSSDTMTGTMALDPYGNIEVTYVADESGPGGSFVWFRQ